MSTLNARIQLRHDTEENWQLVGDTLVPLAGEACLTTDGDNKGKVKYGDGTSTWNQLQYSGGQDVVEVDSSIVTFDDDFTFTYQFGKYAPGSDGSVTVPATGKTLDALLLDAFAEEKNPIITQPSISVSSSQMKAYEAGTNVTPSYNTNFNAGKYQYGPATGVTVTTYSVTLDDETLDTASGSFSQIQVEDATNIRIAATANYGAGAIPLTNLGSEYAAGQIQAGSTTGYTGYITGQAGSTTGYTGYITGYRQIFYGPDSGTDAITSATIRALTAGGRAAAATTINSIQAQSGTKRIIIAVPQSSGLEVTAANITTSLNADVTSSYVKQEAAVQVEGANGYTAVPYDVFVYQPASIDPTENHKVVLG